MLADHPAGSDRRTRRLRFRIGEWTRPQILAFVVAACVAHPGGLLAQTASGVTITPEQRTAIRKHVLQEKRPTVAAPDGFVAAVGAVIPAGIELFWMPPEAGVNRYRYTVVGGRAFIVDPEGRRIIEALE